ncbi:PIN-like domain-containing protein [Actinokineospora bangkokensis]|uniref:VapC45 PIN like domain-containing protein n=1 Tax=Actinokineospora bangkokensis TaxID=1193682 RepID=A0A1Q9LCU1_9PSEU|nr:hypothetical protein [Actinokineospora bangkokensis]OLR89833.1 hypothetical protein BJP25_02075 [Actinokineospora bangkokensis]
MKFFIDHNLSPRLIPNVAAIHGAQQFSCARDEGLAAVDDIPLFAELRGRGFDAIVTRDANQLADPQERIALIESGLHWIGLRGAKVAGLAGLALDSAAITVGLTLVLPELAAGTQAAYPLKAIPHQREQRIKAIALSRS